VPPAAIPRITPQCAEGNFGALRIFQADTALRAPPEQGLEPVVGL
jgi:hypothetical protein